MDILFFIISLLSSAVGSLSGIGGGVIIKPVLDAANVLPVSTISFLSGCTVLTMAVVSLLRQRGSDPSHGKIDARRTTPLAIGAALGGVIGKYVFDIVKTQLHESLLGGIQALLLFIMTAGVLVFVLFRHKIDMLDVQNLAVAFLVGIALGIISAFLGIGGGPMNIAVLYYFFSMRPKEAAVNSLYIIMFSQIASILFSLAAKTIPTFPISTMLLMMAGGVFGALIGSSISKRISGAKVEVCLKILLLVIMAINVYNIICFF